MNASKASELTIANNPIHKIEIQIKDGLIDRITKTMVRLPAFGLIIMPNLIAAVSKQQETPQRTHIHLKILLLPTAEPHILHKATLHKLLPQQPLPHDLIPRTEQLQREWVFEDVF